MCSHDVRVCVRCLAGMATHGNAHSPKRLHRRPSVARDGNMAPSRRLGVATLETMAAPLDPALWAEIRHEWEYAPDAPSYAAAATRAAHKHGFQAPGRAAVCRRATAEIWERRGSMVGVNVAAQAKADALATGGNAGNAKNGMPPEENARLTRAAREESEDLRAAITDRHRRDWELVGNLVTEAQERRATDPREAFERMKLAKISAETITLRHAGERKAWGMDILDAIGAPSAEVMAKMTDAQLEAISKGRARR